MSRRSSEYFSFTCRGRDRTEAFEGYRRLYAHGSDVVRSDDPFEAEVRGWRLEGMLLFERRLSGMTHVRENRVARDDFDHIVVHALLSGELHGGMASGFDSIGPRELVFLDTRQSSRTTPRNAHLLTASVARHLADAAVGEGAALHGRILRPPDSLILIDYMVSLAARIGALGGPLRAYSRAFVDLLSGALGTGSGRAADLRRQHFLQREAVERFIDSHLGDRDLSVGTIAASLPLSRSTLYRLFESQGGVARLIQRRRLAAAAAALERGSEAPLADLADQCGFAGEAHMSRLFAQEYGRTPGAYREAVRTIAEGDARTGLRRWRGWMTELA